MELYTLTSEFRAICCMDMEHISFNNLNYNIQIIQLSENNIIFKCNSLFFNLNDKMQLFLSFNEKDYIFDIHINNVYQDIFIYEADVLIKSKEDFHLFLSNIKIQLDRMKNNLKKIICTKKNMKILQFHNYILFNESRKKLNSLLKSISAAEAVFLIRENELITSRSFTLTFTFYNPDESIIYSSIRPFKTKLLTFAGINFIQLNFFLPENENLQKRIINYDEAMQKKIKVLKYR